MIIVHSQIVQYLVELRADKDQACKKYDRPLDYVPISGEKCVERSGSSEVLNYIILWPLLELQEMSALITSAQKENKEQAI